MNSVDTDSFDDWDFAKAEDVPTAVRTLIANRYVLENVYRHPGYILFDCHRYDEFGVQLPYTFALCERPLDTAAASAIERHASHRGGYAVLIGTPGPSAPVSSPWSRFLSLFGGPVRSWLPLEPEFGTQLNALGRNRLPDGLVGNPDDLFEEYVQLALQFLLSDRVIRYGKRRSGESLPDGIAFGRADMMLMYDAKAYADGYDVSAETIRQFADYVNRFHRRYESYVGRLFAFLVISGDFQESQATEEARSQQLYRDCGVPLRFLRAGDLGKSIELLVNDPVVRRAIDWRDVFSHNSITISVVRRAVASVRRDGLVR